MASEYKKLQSSIKKLHKVCEQAKRIKLSVKVNGKKQGLSETTLHSYVGHVQNVMNRYFEKHGIGDVTKFEQSKVHEILKEIENPFSQKAITHALNWFQQATEKTPVFRAGLHLVDIDEMKRYWKDHHIIRKASDSTTMKATIGEIKTVIKTLEESRSPFKEIAITALKFSLYTGARAEGILKSSAKNITFHENGSATVYLIEKGNNPRWVRIRPDEKEALAFLRSLKSSLKENQYIIPRMVYTSGKKKGQIMDYRAATQRLDKIIGSAARRAGIYKEFINSRGEKSVATISLHAARKAFCQARIDYYKVQDIEELRAEVQERIRENKRLIQEIQERNRNITNKNDWHPVPTDIEKKYNDVWERINYVDRDKGERRTAEDRDLNHKELTFFLTSLDSGHFRTDVIRFYGEYDY
jgi:hypothetical protein